MGAKIGRPKTGRKPNFSIRIHPDALQWARDAAVTQRKTLGQWLEEAIQEKIEREQKGKSPLADKEEGGSVTFCV